ncbi:MAG: ferrochelatase [Bacteriovoracaceae bacterium]|nr:ferrochelatase [Bacteriovoracaceae bacterium]
MSEGKTKVVFVQLGSPKSPKVSDVRAFLKEFLADPRVVDINPFVWKLILNLFVLPFRPKRSAKLYSRIWDGTSFPLITITKAFTDRVRGHLTSPKVEVNHAFLLTSPRVNEVWDDWEADPNPAVKLKVVPMFPQYSESTIASGIDGLASEIKGRVKIPELSIMTNFHTSKAFIDNSVKRIDESLLEFKNKGVSVDRLLLTFHGIQKRRVVTKGDAYYKHCYETYFLIKTRLQNITQDKITITFQSRFGSEEWLTPYTEDTVIKLVESGEKKLAVYSPSFVADCLETLDELGTELKETAHEHGGDIHFIPCLNDNDKWCKDFAHFIENQCLADDKTREKDFYTLEVSDYREFNEMSAIELKQKSPPLTTEAKSSLKIIFLTIFLDLVGFSIIFPLFPSLAKHYLTVDADNVFLKAIFGSIQTISQYTEGSNVFSGIVLFGGILGALYSFLQFIAAPMWGSLSDRVGRKPVLLVSLTGLALSYILWFFSGSFTLLIIARILGGIMGGNISTATAVVADVTSPQTRSKGMAVIGIAFALGFVIGPAIGGILSLIDLTKIYPEWSQYGVNPFSMPAALSFMLAFINIIWVSKRFKESLPPEKRGLTETVRSANPFKIFKPLPYPGVNIVNFGNFLFLSAFSGMEFTLTFLAFERLGYTSMQNAYLFIFIGFILAMVQGGYVRRKAGQIGEKKMAIQGLYTLIPGLICIGLAHSSWLLYVGLFFLSVGSSMIIPCLTSLVTLYTPPEEQGRSVGIFRSLGALARVVGPITAAIIYYQYGSAYPYYLGAIFLIIPIVMLMKLPEVKKESGL